MTEINPIRYEDGALRALDQTLLPAEEVWIELGDAEAVAEAIRSLRVRGAPLIGVTAAYGLAVVARAAEDLRAALERAAPMLRSARPTAVNLARAVDRVLERARSETDVAEAVEREALSIHEDERQACEAMGKLGAELLPGGARVLTHCNTGALATGGIGTALGVIRTASVSHVWVPETRPLLQGSRLTAWELGRLGIRYAIVPDVAVGSLFGRALVDGVVVGADRIAANGDVANKVGTYALAVLARRHGIPFYVAAPTSTVDPATPSGADIPIEERDAEEVLARASAPMGAEAFNPAFDVTPAELVTAIVTETAVHRPPFGF